MNQNAFNIETRLNMLIGGIKIGYQLVIKERLVLDFTCIGPGYGWFQAKAIMSGDISTDTENEYLAVIKEIMIKKYPYLESTLQSGQFSKQGRLSYLSSGFYYSVKIGYAF
jgi:hypothetical protein